MRSVYYPRILIVGNSFDKKSGGGITLTNLFKGWEKENIAVAASGINELDLDICERYYRLGSLERQIRFPVSKIGKKTFIESGNIKTEEKADFQLTSIVREKSILGNFFRSIYYKIYDFIGLEHYSYRLKTSIEFKNWIMEFNPDIIYCQLSTLETILFISDLHFLLNKPIAIHFMDDWPVTITNRQKGVFKKYWEKFLDRDLRHLLSNAAILLSISEAMSEAYYTRYGLKFIPYHNPITIEEWLPFSKNDWSLNGTFRIIYTGRIGTANNKSILFVSSVINTLNQSNIKIKLDIYTPFDSTETVAPYLDYEGVEIKSPVPYEYMPELLSQYDLLLLPLDFDEAGINFARYSMPTKASEYMISGTPILVFASMQTALAKYAAKEGWAYVVTNSDRSTLLSALKELLSNQLLRMNLAKKAREIAIRTEDAKIVRENFRQSLCLNKNKSY
jgi:glycosyltransferase involved in cell wall biosynthesis